MPQETSSKKHSDLTVEQKLEMYRRMQRIRRFDLAAEVQLKEGNIPGVCHSSIGQEAAIVGACMAMRNDDYMAGNHRSHGHPIGKGARLGPLMAELMGKATGICKGRGGSMHLADASVGSIGESSIVGGGIPLAAGAALSAQVRGTDQVSLCFFGDGAANEGVFAESMNMAAIWKLPVIFFCENNHYALSTPVLTSHGQPDIARRGDGYGIPGVIVDGQDADAVYQISHVAVERARRGEGPTLIEAKTYRFDEHAIGLTVTIPYRDAAEIETYKTQKDPLTLYRSALLREGIKEEVLTGIEAETATEVEDAVSFALASDFPTPADLYDHMYGNPIHYPPQASNQRAGT